MDTNVTEAPATGEAPNPEAVRHPLLDLCGEVDPLLDDLFTAFPASPFHRRRELTIALAKHPITKPKEQKIDRKSARALIHSDRKSTMHRAIFVNFPQVEAPAEFSTTVEQQLDEIAAHCPGLLGCAIHVDRERLISHGPAVRFRVRVRIRPRSSGRLLTDDHLREQVDADLGAALRRAVDAAKRAARGSMVPVQGQCLPAMQRPGNPWDAAAV